MSEKFGVNVASWALRGHYRELHFVTQPFRGSNPAGRVFLAPSDPRMLSQAGMSGYRSEGSSFSDVIGSGKLGGRSPSIFHIAHSGLAP